ncbi:hypothetical protein CPB84DRAFT_1040895 [Gymnopilus junonius]|uniref:Uncharacterized protein n=1 Tax=Gymnopilus junonius TaxID=109634 RepID=A0A9P5NP48_GYMJU|nr:hypothetical protein CPB84DRAFT_1040895 [Gymnopilus junonius]
MKFILSTALLSLASLASGLVIPRQFCPEVTRFGILIVNSPTNATSFNPGDPIHIHADFNCAINTFGIKPEFTDYTLEVPVDINNGFEPRIVLARRTLAPGATTDDFTVTLPHWDYIPNSGYSVFLTDVYPTKGYDGSALYVEGTIEAGLTINPPTL